MVAVAHLVTFRSGHLTLRLPARRRLRRPFHSLYLANFISVSQSVGSSHFRAAIAIRPPARVVSIFPDMKWDWKENKRRTDGTELRGETLEEGRGESTGNPGMGRAQSFLINFDPTEGTDRVTE